MKKDILKRFFPTTSLKVLFAMLCCSFVFWGVLTITGSKYTTANYLISVPLILITLFGGVVALRQRRKGTATRELKKSVLFISVGLIFWSLGSAIFMFYNMVWHIEAPYPSLAEVGYLPAPIAWIIGLVYLCKAVDVESHLRLVVGRVLFFLIPIIAVILSFYALIFLPSGAEFHLVEEPVKLFFNFIYPVFDVLIMVILSLLIYGVCFRFVHIEQSPAVVIIALSFIMNYLADYFFTYTTSNNTYFVGHYVDMLFIVAMFGISWGVNLLAIGKEKIV